MLAIGIVEAIGADQQIVQNSIVQDRFFDDARNIFDFDVTVEDPLRVNRDTRTVLALIETAGGVGSYKWAESAGFDLSLERIPQRFGTCGITTAAWMTGSTLIAADKQMMSKCGHGRLSSPYRDREGAACSTTAAPSRSRYGSVYSSNLIHEICVTNWLSDANDRCAFVAKRGVLLAGNVASEASPTRKTLKSFDRFS